MAWYGNHMDSSRKLDQLIDSNPNLQQLLNYPDFLQQLKSYNPKLLDFLTNSSHIITQLINYITMAPKQQDSLQRKHKLPTLSIQMIQSDAICILNSFFKENTQKKQKHLIVMINQLLNNQQTKNNNNSINNTSTQLLPLLAGYLLRVNIALLNHKYKQLIDLVYQNQKIFQFLLSHSQNQAISNILQLYLNLDLTKNNIIINQRLMIKIKTINNIMKSIEQCCNDKDSQSINKILKLENLSSVLIEILQKYYLIADGKPMVDQILNQQAHINIIFNKKYFTASGSKQLSLSQQCPIYQTSLSLMTIMISILKYFSFSSYNSEQWSNPQSNKKNQILLQSQLAIIKFMQLFPSMIECLTLTPTLTLYHQKIIQTINTAFTLNSHKIFNLIKKHKYLQLLIDLMFKHENANILSMMIEKLFLLIFRTERLINEEIKTYIFCDAKIIDLTAARYMAEFNSSDQILAASMSNNYRRKAYFGHLMKIMKIYSSIQTTNQDIINAIKSRSDTWNRISRFILKPYEFINCKQLGTYDNITQLPPLQFSVKSIINVNSNIILNNKKQLQNNKLIDEINREQNIQILKTLQNHNQNKIQPQTIFNINNLSNVKNTQSIQLDKKQDEFFKPPTSNNPNSPQKAYSKLQQLITTTSQSSQSQSLSNNQNQQSLQPIPLNHIQKQQSAPQTQQFLQQSSQPKNRKSLSYNDFLQKQKVKVQTQIKKQRSRSKQRALSKGKTKITSPSPTKRVNKWADNNNNENVDKQQIKERSSLPVNIQRPVIHNNNIIPTNTTTTSPAQPPKPLPKIPHHKKGLHISSSSSFLLKQDPHNKSMQLTKLQQSSLSSSITDKLSKSMVDLNQLKKIKIIYQFDAPSKKQFRKVTEEDKAVFDMLGIVIQ